MPKVVQNANHSIITSLLSILLVVCCLCRYGNFNYDDGLFTGAGNFSYASTSSNITLAGLKAFDFNLMVSNSGDSPDFYATFSPMPLATLNSFSATVNSGLMTSLSMDTAYVYPISSNCGLGCAFWNEELHALGLNGYTCSVCSDFYGETPYILFGPVTQTGFVQTNSSVVPEPASLAFAWHRRRKL
jgi:hypothetical protein